MMKSQKMKIGLILLVLLIFGLLPSGIAAYEKDNSDYAFVAKEDSELLDIVTWKGSIANAETGESIPFNSNDEQLVTQSSDAQLIYFNDTTGEKHYFKEIVVSLPENVDQHGYGTEISSPMTDDNKVIAVVLGLRYATGDYGIYQVVRIDGVYVDWEITDPTVSLQDVELGYRISNGIGVENGAVNELMLWDLETTANSFETERIAPSPWFLRTKDFIHCRTIFSGNLVQENGVSRPLVLEFDYSN